MTADSHAILHTICTETLIRAMSIMVTVDGLKAANAQFPENQPHGADRFAVEADRLRGLADYVSGCLSSHAHKEQS